MRAVRFDDKLEVCDVPRPVPARDEVLIRVRLAGICNTDLEITRGYFGFKGVLGHEFVGEVVEAPEATEWVGRRVVGDINLSCGECEYCRRGLGWHCPNRTVLGILGKDGCFAEYLTLPLKNLQEVPANVEEEEAVFTEPLAAAFEILEQALLRPTDDVLVVGDGKLAQLVIRVLRLHGGRVSIVGRENWKLELAERAGAKPVAEVEIENAAFDLVVEASGHPSGWQTAIRAVRPKGTIILKSTYAEVPRIDLTPVVVNEVNVLGSRCGPFAPALAALSARLVETSKLITHRFPLRQAVQAFEVAASQQAMKVLLENS